MSIQAATGVSQRNDSYRAGQDATITALRGVDRADLVLVYASVPYDHERVLQGVRSVAGQAAVLGGSSFGEMTERGLQDGSVSVMALRLGNVRLALGLGTQSDEDPFRAGQVAGRVALDAMGQRDSPGELGLLIAEMRSNEQPLLGLQSTLGPGFPLFGGCCSGNRYAPISDPSFSQGFQYLEDRVHRHAVPLALLSGDFAVSFGVAHGWQPLGTEVSLGRTEGSVVHEIDEEPALSFYARFLGDGQPTAFPLGFLKEGHLILRSARGVAADGGLAFTAPLPQGSKVRITRGNRRDILKSSGAATQHALDALGRDRVKAALVVSCISRRTMLGTRVSQEFDAVSEVLGRDVPMLGFYAAGEYAPPGKLSMYHNCTFCICLLGERDAPKSGGNDSCYPHAAAEAPAAGRIADVGATQKPEEDQRRVLIMTGRESLATECIEVLRDLADILVCERDWTSAKAALDPEYTQAVLIEEQDCALITELEALNPSVQVVVLRDYEHSESLTTESLGVWGGENSSLGGYCRLPVSRSELRFAVGRALGVSRLRVRQRILEHQLKQASRGLQNAENAVETSEQLLTETYRTIEKANRDMRIVLDNVQQGFVTLDREGLMAHGRSKAVDLLLGDWSGSGAFSAYLARCNPSLGQLFGLAWDQVVAGVLPLEVTLDLLPKQWIVGPRHLRFEYVPIQPPGGDPDQIDGMVVVVTDATAEVRKREAEAKQKEALEVFQRMLRDPDGVDQFARDASNMVRALTRDDEEQQDDPAMATRILHSFKGNCGIMGLHRVAAVCHALESEIGEARTGKLSQGQRARLTHSWNGVARLIESFRSQRGDEVAVSRDSIQKLSEKAARGLPASDLSAEIRTLLHESVRRRLDRLAESAEALAVRLEKSPLDVRVEADDLRLEQRQWAPLWSELVHLVRNAIDHGVRPPSERAPRGEPPRILLEARRDGQAFVVRVSDNGPGIDWIRVAEKATKLGLSTATRDDLVAALFADRLSTRDHATETSGRGVGLAAVRRMVDQLGGVITVSSISSHGTTFTLRFDGKL